MNKYIERYSKINTHICHKMVIQTNIQTDKQTNESVKHLRSETKMFDQSVNLLCSVKTAGRE